MAGQGGKAWPSLGRGTLTRGRPSFLTRTATDDAAQLMRRSSLPALVDAHNASAPGPDEADSGLSNGRLASASPQPRSAAQVSTTTGFDGPGDRTTPRKVSATQSQRRNHAEAQDPSAQLDSPSRRRTSVKKTEKSSLPKVGAFPRPVGGTDKLNTFSGVFVPTSLNVLSILMFIRFGFILGQAGVLGMLGMLIAAYMINLFTTMSISAVASNGTVRGGGAYYLISRSLGPEFGGSIGIVSYLGFVFNTGMNAVGLVDCLNYNFGAESGIWSNFLPEGDGWQYLWSTLVVCICVAICLAGSAIFARASNGLLLILLLATFSIPFSSLLVRPFETPEGSKQFTKFTGLSLSTLKENLLPNFTRGASGSQLKGKENYADLFGILFPATGGIFAGASMSGDLKHPSQSIPRGTLYGLALTFVSYALVILAMAASITRTSMYRNVNVIQDTNLSGILVLLGEIATTLFSVLMGIIGPAKQLQAIARDGIFPGISLFGQGTKRLDEPTYAIIMTHIIAQITILFDINRIASFITMTYLLSFFGINLACFLLKLSSAPNFRPSFHYFNWWTAALGAVFSVASMFFVDKLYATGSIGVLVFGFMLIHYTTPPKSWGDVSSGLIYHQIRKYLLRMKNDHVKFWRPQILLFVNDPRRGYKLIQFANSVKKGGLFILGHVIVTDNFGASVPEARRQQAAWAKYIDFSKIKAFVNVAISPSIEWGARNLVLSAGLGGMRPNIVILGFYNLQQFRDENALIDVPSPPPERTHVTPPKKTKRRRSMVQGALPTDTCYIEKRTDVQSYVMVLEDLILKLQTNVAVAVGFPDLELPDPTGGNVKKYIDLWPIQMSAEFSAENDGQQQNVQTSNFDTYTLVLQLGCILNTVPSWKKAYKLRVAVFVEYESDVNEERERVTSLLSNLRIEAEVLVFWLASGDSKIYQHIVNGEQADATTESQVEKVLEDEDWWSELQQFRGKFRSGNVSAVDILSVADDVQWPSASFQSRRDTSAVRFEGLRKILDNPRRRQSFGNVSSLGVSLNMRTHRLDDDMISRHASHPSDSEVSVSESEDSVAEGAETSSDSDVGFDDWHDEVPDEEDMFSSGVRSADRPNSKSLSSKKSSLASSKKSKSSRKKRLLELERYTDNPGGKDDVDVLADVSGGTSDTEDHRGRSGAPADDVSVDGTISSGPERSHGLVLPPSAPRSRAASPNFTSALLPIAKTGSEEGVGPSIMFADDPHPKRQAAPASAFPGTNGRSIYQRDLDGSSPPRVADGYPAAAAIPLSFNDLPCRAQHLILNDLISQYSDDTAVIFTTLPAPADGMYKSESESLGYVSDLEVLTGGLPPCLLVHSNSMTVTMNL